MPFDFAILKVEIDKSMKIKKTLKHWSILNTQNPLKTSLNNLIWSNLVVLEPTLNLTIDWPSLIDFNKVSQDLITMFSQSDHLIITVNYKHKYFTHSTNPTVRFWISIWFHDGHMLLYPPTGKLWLIHWHNLTIQNGWNTPSKLGNDWNTHKLLKW